MSTEGKSWVQKLQAEIRVSERIRHFWRLRRATVVEVWQDLALASHQAAGVHAEFDRKRQNRLAMILSYSGLKGCVQKAGTPAYLVLTASLKGRAKSYENVNHFQKCSRKLLFSCLYMVVEPICDSNGIDTVNNYTPMEKELENEQI